MDSHDEQLARAAAAFALVAERRRRLEALLVDPYALGVGPDIHDPEVMRGARR